MVHGPGNHQWDVRPGTASAVPSASAFGRAQAIGPTRRELLQEVARENGESLDGSSSFGASFNSFGQRGARGSSGAEGQNGFGGGTWNESARGRGGDDDEEGKGGGKFQGDSAGNFEPGIRSPPSSPAPPAMRGGKALYTTQNLDTSDIRAFLMEPGPKNGSILCHIRREKGKLGYPYYAVYLEAPGVMPGSPEGERFLLSARKRKKSKTSNYLISIDLDDTSRQSGNYFGKLRSNFVGTEFTIYDCGVKPSEASGPEGPQPRCELGAVLYQYNVLGTRGPRKMTAIVPRVNERGERVAIRPRADKDKEQILRRHKERGDISDELVTMINKPPKWNDQMQAYCLNFNGRVTKASVKNFQLASGDALDHVILQFGKVGKDAFTMDYAWPINALQAFAICLTSFDNKLVRGCRGGAGGGCLSPLYSSLLADSFLNAKTLTGRGIFRRCFPRRASRSGVVCSAPCGDCGLSSTHTFAADISGQRRLPACGCARAWHRRQGGRVSDGGSHESPPRHSSSAADERRRLPAFLLS